MDMSTIDVAFTEQYTANIYDLAQQKGSRFAGKVTMDTVTNAKTKYYERLGIAEVQQIVSRHGDTPLNEIPNDRRALVPTDWNTATLIDKQDDLKMLIEPTNKYAMAQFNGLGRKMDDIVIAAAYGSAATGVAGGTPVTFANDSVSMNGGGDFTTLGTAATPGTQTQITLAKILAMLQLYNEEDVDPDITKYWAVSPYEIEVMLNIEEIGSADYNTVKALAAGKVESFAGFTWFFTNRLALDSTEGTTTRTLSWAEDGLVLGLAEGVKSRISERDDKNYSVQVYSEMSLGALRLEGAKVHEALMATKAGTP
jgi:hypothetical protein